MRRENDRSARGGGLIENLVQDFHGIRIESGIGFVEQDHGRIVEHHARDAQPLMKTSREGTHGIGCAVPKSHAIEEGLDSLIRIRHSIKPGEEAQVFDGRQVAIQIGVVG